MNTKQQQHIAETTRAHIAHQQQQTASYSTQTNERTTAASFAVAVVVGLNSKHTGIQRISPLQMSTKSSSTAVGGLCDSIATLSSRWFAVVIDIVLLVRVVVSTLCNMYDIPFDSVGCGCECGLMLAYMCKQCAPNRSIVAVSVWCPISWAKVCRRTFAVPCRSKVTHVYLHIYMLQKI